MEAPDTQYWLLGVDLNADRTDRSKHEYATVQVQGGKEVIPAKELINLAHKNGFVRSELQIINIDMDEGSAVVMATVYFADGSSYMDIGDATSENTNSMTAASFPRMAATRALSRALAQALNADTNAAEEINSGGGGGGNRSSFRGNTSKASGTSKKSKSSDDDDDDDWDD